MKKPIIVGVVVAVLLALCGFGGCALLAGGTVAAVSAVDTEVSKQAADRKADVKITKCELSDFETVEIEYSITNRQGTMTSYFPQFEIIRGGVRVGTAAGFDSDVPSLKKVNSQAIGVVTGKGKATCKLVSA